MKLHITGYISLMHNIIRDGEAIKNIDQTLDKCKIYINKYDKYIDIATIRLLKQMCDCDKKVKKKTKKRQKRQSKDKKGKEKGDIFWISG